MPRPSRPPTLRSLRQRRRAIEEVARNRGVTSVKVFGSVARGEAQRDSDIDLLVEIETGRSLLDLGGFVEDLTELLGRPVHVVTKRTPHGELGENVLAEAVPL